MVDMFSAAGSGAISGAAAGSVAGPWGAAAGAVIGAGISIFGASQQSEAAERSNAAQRQIIEAEQKIEAQKRQAMELDYRRKSLQLVRNAQKARALALTNATSQGASQGSGLQGGYGQISGDSTTSAVGLSQNVMIGRNIFDLNAQISQQRIEMANAGLQQQQGAAYSSLGGSILGSAGTIGRLSSGWGPSNNSPGNFPSSTAIY